MFTTCFLRISNKALSQMLETEACFAMEIEQHPTFPTSINADIFPAATADDCILKVEDNSELSVNNNLYDLGNIFGDPLEMSPPIFEEVCQQNNDVEDLFGQTQEEDNNDDGINLMG